MTKKKDIEENWNSIWKDILEKPDGSIDKEQLKMELFDFSNLIDRHTTIVHRITGGMMSYPTYEVEAVMQEHEEYLTRQEEDRKSDDLENGYCSYCNQEIEEKQESKHLDGNWGIN